MDKTIASERSDGTEPMGILIVAITGATGFIGRQLVEAFLKREGVLVRILTRNTAHAFNPHPRLTVIAGDLTKSNTLSDFLVPGCMVINLAYDFSLMYAENICASENLLRVCKERHIKRLVHCSTVSVYGRNKKDVLIEETVCNPTTTYGLNKLEIERLLQEGARGNFEFINLRLTSVFGPGGLTLKKLIDDLAARPMIFNHFKSCLFNIRKLNLVSLCTVVAAIVFILNRGQEVVGQTFIISDDENANNNFEYVERYLLQEIYGKKYALRPIRIPLVVLATILWILGRDNTNPQRIFDSGKLRKLGFLMPRPFESSLSDFVRWEIGKRDQGGHRNSAVSSGR